MIRTHIYDEERNRKVERIKKQFRDIINRNKYQINVFSDEDIEKNMFMKPKNIRKGWDIMKFC